MNRMEFEAIKHDACKKVFEGTEYDWLDMLDNTAEAEKKTKGMDENEMNEYWTKYFSDMLIATRWSDEQTETETD